MAGLGLLIRVWAPCLVGYPGGPIVPARSAVAMKW